jgi:hypothetical protein
MNNKINKAVNYCGGFFVEGLFRNRTALNCSANRTRGFYGTTKKNAP